MVFLHILYIFVQYLIMSLINIVTYLNLNLLFNTKNIFFFKQFFEYFCVFFYTIYKEKVFTLQLYLY
jgi:hypothetical protein